MYKIKNNYGYVIPKPDIKGKDAQLSLRCQSDTIYKQC